MSRMLVVSFVFGHVDVRGVGAADVCGDYRVLFTHALLLHVSALPLSLPLSLTLSPLLLLPSSMVVLLKHVDVRLLWL